RIDPETRCETSAHGAPNECIDTLTRTRASQEPIWPPPRHENLGDHLGSVRCSSCLRFQLFCVETFSSLPKCQSNGRDFARQRQTNHLRLHALGQQSRVEIVEGSPPAAGPGGRTLEDFFHLMVVVLIETTELLGVSWSVAIVHGQSGIAHCRASQSPGHYRSTVVACFGTGAGFARSSGLLESDRCRESGAAASLPYVSGSRPKTRVAGFAARPVIHPAVGRATPRGGARRFAESCSTIPPDSAGHRPGYRHRECPSLGTLP